MLPKLSASLRVTSCSVDCAALPGSHHPAHSSITASNCRRVWYDMSDPGGPSVDATLPCRVVLLQCDDVVQRTSRCCSVFLYNSSRGNSTLRAPHMVADAIANRVDCVAIGTDSTTGCRVVGSCVAMLSSLIFSTMPGGGAMQRAGVASVACHAVSLTATLGGVASARWRPTW